MYKVSKLDKSDMPEIERLLSTRNELDPQGAAVRTQLMEWTAFHNPAAEDLEATYFVAKDEGKVIAFHGRMPNYFNWEGRKVKGYFVHDLYVDPEYRKKGKGFWLTIALAKAIEQESDSFFCLYGMTKLNLQMQRRRGYFETSVPIYWKYLTASGKIEKLVKLPQVARLLSPIGTTVLKLLDQIILPLHSRKLDVSEVERCDAQFNILFEKLKTKTKLCSYKDASYLNWKFMDRPYKREKILVARKNNELIGYLVYGVQPKAKNQVGIILDIQVNAEDQQAIGTLIGACIKALRNQGAQVIQCICSDSRYQAVLKKLMFIKGKGTDGTKTVMLGNLEKTDISPEAIKNMNNWHFTRSESDAFLLSQ